MTSYYHVITTECMIISNLWSQENLTHLPEILLGHLILTLVKKKKRQTMEESWNTQSKSQSWGGDSGDNESYGREADEVQLAGLLLTSCCVIHLHPWGRGPLSYVILFTYSYDKPRHHSKKQRHHIDYKGPYSQSYVFPVVTYGCESWTIKETKCPRTDAFKLMLEKTLESPLDSKEIKPVNPKRNQPWIFRKLRSWHLVPSLHEK